MKKVEIRQFSFAEVDAPKETFGFLKIPVEHTLIRAEGESLEVSDGYHTMDELYEFRKAITPPSSMNGRVRASTKSTRAKNIMTENVALAAAGSSLWRRCLAAR